ncbi:hypothetical protein MRX96_019458 [Rhipicephalus microplus]
MSVPALAITAPAKWAALGRSLLSGFVPFCAEQFGSGMEEADAFTLLRHPGGRVQARTPLYAATLLERHYKGGVLHNGLVMETPRRPQRLLVRALLSGGSSVGQPAADSRGGGLICRQTLAGWLATDTTCSSLACRTSSSLRPGKKDGVTRKPIAAAH